MSSQKEIWEKEHLEETTFKRIHSDQPSAPIPDFAYQLACEFFWCKQIRVTIVGCGKGRNDAYLGKYGFKVTGMDFSEKAVQAARSRYPEKNILFGIADLAKPWPIKSGSQEGVVDCNTTICMPNPGRDLATKEAYRVLRKGGYYLFYGVAETEMVRKLPGPEPNSTIFPQSGKFEKQYSKEELLASYVGFELVSIKQIPGSDIVEGKETEYSMWVAVFKKP